MAQVDPDDPEVRRRPELAQTAGVVPPGDWGVPAEYDLRRRWPNADFSWIRDPQLRRMCEDAQDLARSLRQALDGRQSRLPGRREMSRRELAREARVGPNTVDGLLDGTRFTQPARASRIATVLGLGIGPYDLPE